MTVLKTGLSLAVVAAFALQHTVAQAGTAEVRGNEGHQVKFEYNAGKQVRITPERDASGYMLVDTNDIYMVSTEGGQVMVVSLAQSMKMFGAQAMAASPATVEGKLISLKATGRHETVAGIRGDVYAIRYTDGDGVEHSDDMVLSGDPRAVEFQEALYAMSSSMARAANRDLEGAEEMQRRFMDMNMGILRFGQSMWVTSLTDTTVPDSAFALPAAPTDMSALQGMFGGGSGAGAASDSGDSALGAAGSAVGGFFSGVFGDKTERQADRVEGQTESKIDQKTDQAVDSALDKAFNKIFGD